MVLSDDASMLIGQSTDQLLVLPSAPTGSVGADPSEATISR